ncbi:MAG: hypothetical protein ACLFPO_08350 [Spirochaetaceae bacterium]
MSFSRRAGVIAACCITIILSSCATLVRARDPARGHELENCGARAYLASDLCHDEKELLDWAAAYPFHRSLSDLTAENLRAIAAATGSVDQAAAVFYHRVVSEPHTRRFIEEIHSTERRLSQGGTGDLPDYTDSNVLFAFVPGMFYEDIDIRGLKGEPLIEAATDLGLPSVVLPVDQTGTVVENAERIASFLREHAAGYEEIIVATASKGAADFAVMLDEYRTESFVSRIRTWFNIAGILEPSPLVDTIEDRPGLRVRARLFFLLNGYDYSGFQSMGSTFEGRPGPLARPLHRPDHIDVVTIVGVPLEEHVTHTARPFYRVLSDAGPNDGFLLHAHSIRVGGPIYPAWRNDHYFQWSLPPERVRAFIVNALE